MARVVPRTRCSDRFHSRLTAGTSYGSFLSCPKTLLRCSLLLLVIVKHSVWRLQLRPAILKPQHSRIGEESPRSKELAVRAQCRLCRTVRSPQAPPSKRVRYGVAISCRPTSGRAGYPPC